MKQPTKETAALQRARADLTSAFEDVDRLAAEKRELESQLAARFVEVAALTRIARLAEDERDAAVGQSESLSAELVGLRATVDGLRQEAARRYQAAILAVVGAAPWRWLPGRMRAAALSPLVRRTGLLDEQWYVGRYGDVAASGFDPVRHFIAYGAKEGRLPNPDTAAASGDGADRTD